MGFKKKNLIIVSLKKKSSSLLKIKINSSMWLVLKYVGLGRLRSDSPSPQEWERYKLSILGGGRELYMDMHLVWMPNTCAHASWELGSRYDAWAVFFF